LALNFELKEGIIIIWSSVSLFELSIFELSDAAVKMRLNIKSDAIHEHETINSRRDR